MNIEVYNALIELVKQGGTLALWGISIWLAFAVVKVSLVSLVGYLVVRCISQTVQFCYKANLDNKATTISLLSTKVTEDLTRYLTEFQQSLSSLLKDLESQFQDSKKG